MADLKTTQERVHSWTQAVFENDLLGPTSLKERGSRFIEEAIELAQALDFSREEIIRVVDWVLSRPKGSAPQEVSGTLVTLLSLCNLLGIDASAELDQELARIETPEVMARIRNRQSEKNKILGLTGPTRP